MDDDTTWQIVGYATSHALSDKVWQIFGYAKRPKHGRIFNVFRARWKTELETRLIHELMITPIAVQVILGSATMRDIEHVIAARLGHGGVAETLSYESTDASIRGLYKLIEEYSKTPIDDWTKLLVTRLHVPGIPDRQTAANLLAGSAKYAIMMRGVLVEHSG
ncbi:hypothetical protein N9B12_00820 [bacterium]|jgi:hypothetical protein|nr:hypothetical protein [Mariniblastus sp.]MDA7887579.1 hypothetical protein [bacterium]MDA7913355.1 hypothetical protein [bacterium]MDA7926204.1 hypothetical protein [Mariniblastus sp.]MDB4391813.1 hypothetical protein [bacterium]|tara:strand:- start:1745 stop:2233 length:489 start_codon:yes stop_codon:yes gene_type:complete